jgi:hypothetical protein
MAYAPSGFLWENALRNGKTVRVYGEYAVDLEVVSGEFGTWTDFYQDYLILRGEAEGELHVDLETRSDIPSLDMLLNRDYPNYTMVIPDVYRVEFFLKEFAEYVENGNLPDLIMMHLPTDHTAGTNAGYPTPGAMIADNDLALARVVEAVAHSPYWKDSVFFIIEDDAQNGVDHVDGHRTIGFVVSPYTKRGIVDSRYYTQIDFVRTMEQILGLPPMNQMDLAVPPDSMAHIFTMKPDFTPYEALPNLIPLDQMNPSATLLSSAERVWQEASSKLDFSGPDRADEEVLNRIIWHSAKGYATPYPKDDGKLLTPDEL